MLYCLVCKDLAQDHFTVRVQDALHDTSVEGNVCRPCFLRFTESGNGHSFRELMKPQLRRLLRPKGQQ